MVDNTAFVTDVRRWIDGVREDLPKVLKQATLKTMEQSNITKMEGGLLPVDTGALRDSVFLSDGSLSATGRDSLAGSAASAKDGVELQGGYTVHYAPYVEYGVPSQNRPPAGFLDRAVKGWTPRVAQVAKEIRDDRV